MSPAEVTVFKREIKTCFETLHVNKRRMWIQVFLYHAYQVSSVLCLWGVAGVEAVPGSALWAGAGRLSREQAVWRAGPDSTRELRGEQEEYTVLSLQSKRSPKERYSGSHLVY